ncbi:MAG: preprotein translocase subunit SecA [Acidimicrobiales bacterium]|nr:preprotein translocase subunit SecA [Acidimicrobiales bacterium]
MKLFDKILKAGDGKRLKTIQSVVAPVNAIEPEIEKLSDAELKAKTAEFRTRLDNGETLDHILVEAFAVTREGAKRVLGQRHYDVQLMGGAALHFGWVAEMKTGEGKTLVSTLPVYLNALGGKGVHVVTVNEYLASRDAEWMGRLHNWLGLTYGLVVPGMNDSAVKREQYARDITYGTNNEFGFDYLRDNMARTKEAMTQRGHNYAIVDEIDSILIDEARTPLIISGKVKGAADLYTRFSQIAARLKPEIDYEVDEEKRLVTVTEEGINTVEAALGIENLYDGVQGDLVHHLNQSLRAKELFKRDKDYLIADGEVKIVDEFTGRVLEGRRWSDGLHQAVESKEGVAIKEEQQTMATVTLQNYFRMYEKLSGMTGTAQSDAAELETTYSLPVVPIPTNEPIARIDQPDLIYKTEDGKYESVVEDVFERVRNGQPILVGTASVEKSEKISRLFAEKGVEHEVLNAKQHFREADIVAQAGQPGAVTVATNMAGRGVDIVLGGNAEKLAERDTRAEGYELGGPDPDPEAEAYYQKRLDYWSGICEVNNKRVIEAGGLYVLATERHESRRIDNQLRGRSGRQGDPGESRFYLSLDDDLMRIFATGAMSSVMDRAMPDDVPIESKLVTKSVERAQQTVEQRNAETRKNVLKYDEVFNQQRKVIYARRLQLIEQGDLREDTLAAIETTANGLVVTHCGDDLEDTWDLEALIADTRQFWPTELTEADLVEVKGLKGLREILVEDATGVYEKREAELGPEVMRQVENQIMLQLIDQRWREHLTEMDQLREGIGLRAMGQRDPLTEFQREGFDMFSGMMTALETDYVRYIMHVQMVQKPASPPPEESKAPESSRDSGDVKAKGLNAPVPTTTDMQAQKADVDAGIDPNAPKAPADRVAKPKINDEWANTGRNEPCPCGSGKKFKKCHGAA